MGTPLGVSFDQHRFVRARQRYWKDFIKRLEPEIKVTPEDQTPVETNFISQVAGPSPLWAVFEDEGETGYLYVYEHANSSVIQYVHVYDRSNDVQIQPQDVTVLWNRDQTKCGVMILRELRAIIDTERNIEVRVWLERADSPGIRDRQWLESFEFSSAGGPHVQEP